MACHAETEIIPYGHLEWCAHWRQGLKEPHGFYLKKKKELEKSKDCGIMSMLLIVLDNLKDWHDKHKILSYWLKAQAKIKSELSMAVLK